MTKRKIVRSCFCFFLVLVTVLSYFCGCSNFVAESESETITHIEEHTEIPGEEVTSFFNGRYTYTTEHTYGYNFLDDRVIVIIKPEYEDKEYAMEEFSEVGCVELIEHSRVEGSDLKRFTLMLGVKSKPNVLKALNILDKRDDTLVVYAKIREDDQHYRELESCLFYDRVLVCLYPEYEKKEYTAEDFSEVGCVRIDECYRASDDPMKEYRVYFDPPKTLEEYIEKIRILDEREDVYLAHENTFSHVADQVPSD